MHGKLSRRKLAGYVADSVRDGVVPGDIIAELAAYLIETGRQRELTLIIRTIEDVLAERGMVVATVTSATPLDDALRQAVIARLQADDVRLRDVVNPSVIGGVKVQTPSQTFDTTIAHKLTLLRGAKL